MNAAEWRWFGNAGHFIGGRNCRFHLATQVGPWWVSTVGEYLPHGATEYQDLGGGKFETMVFPAGPPCEEAECGRCETPTPVDWTGVDSDSYDTVGDATRGHYAMCEKWASVPATATDDCEAVVSEKKP